MISTDRTVHLVSLSHAEPSSETCRVPCGPAAYSSPHGLPNRVPRTRAGSCSGSGDRCMTPSGLLVVTECGTPT
ncbi:hypothetical protein BN903_37 [Halorubrum sp. AJ67]|nr:hypothetical protein BN903_37 [Halorubrum sp. AJ67]